MRISDWSSDVCSSDLLERYLLLVNDLPGISGTGVLRPSGSELGGSELVVTVERKRFDGFAVADNPGSRLTGPWGAAVAVAGNGLTRLGARADALLYSALDAPEERIALGAYPGPMGERKS